MESMKVYGGEPILNMAINEFYKQNRENFTWKGTPSASGAFTESHGGHRWFKKPLSLATSILNNKIAPSFSFDITKAPTVALIEDGQENLIINIDGLHIKLSSAASFLNQIKSFEKTYLVIAKAFLEVSNGILKINLRSIAIDNPDVIEQWANDYINDVIIPKIEESLCNIEIPQLHLIFGRPLAAKIQAAKVIAGPVFEVGAIIYDEPNLQEANEADNRTVLRSLIRGDSTSAAVCGLISSQALNYLIERNIRATIRYTINEYKKIRVGVWPLAVDIDTRLVGNFTSTRPVLRIRNGQASASVTVSTNLWVGIKGPLGWGDIPILVPDVNAVVDISLSNANRKGILSLDGIDTIKVELGDWPNQLENVKLVLTNLFNAVLGEFKGEINRHVSGIKLELFTLPESIPGTGLNASLSFEQNGLSFYESSVKALLRITV